MNVNPVSLGSRGSSAVFGHGSVKVNGSVTLPEPSSGGDRVERRVATSGTLCVRAPSAQAGIRSATAEYFVRHIPFRLQRFDDSPL